MTPGKDEIKALNPNGVLDKDLKPHIHILGTYDGISGLGQKIKAWQT